MRGVRKKRGGKMCARKLGRFDRLLYVHSELDDVEEELERPLILLVAALGAESQVWLSGARRKRRRERSARPLAGHQSVGMARVEVEGLHPGSEGKAERVDHGRARNPSAARRNRDQVARAIGGGDVNRAGTPCARLSAARSQRAHVDRIAGP